MFLLSLHAYGARRGAAPQGNIGGGAL